MGRLNGTARDAMAKLQWSNRIPMWPIIIGRLRKAMQVTQRRSQSKTGQSKFFDK
jgi:hypothetical protein